MSAIEETDWRVVNRSRQQLKAIPDDVLKHAECVVSLDISESSFTDLSNISLLRKFENLTSLNLSSCGLNRLPEELVDLVMLERLSMSRNHLEKGLCPSIKKLKALKELNVEWCELSDLPDELWSLEKLEKLSISDNTMAKRLSPSISKLKALKEINVGWCGLRNLPDELWSLGKLEKLSLRGNKMELGLSASISKLQALRELDVGMCELRDLPEELWNLKQLEKLSLWGNKIAQGLSASIRKLQALKEVDLSNSQLTDLPEDLWSLEKLETLSLMGNKMAQGLSSSISKLQALKKLNISMCELSDLPEELWNLKQLEKLSMSDNTLAKGLSPSISKLKALKELDVGSCGLRDLPDELWSLGKLEKLSLRGNKIQKGLSASISKLKALKELDVGWCYLSDLPDELWSLENLEKLVLCKTKMAQGLSASVSKLQALKELNVSECELSDLPKELWNLKQLEILQLASNRLVTYPKGSFLLPKLRILDLSNYSWEEHGNRIRELPLNLKDACLETLKLDGNPIVRPPEAIWKQGLDAIKLYMTELSIREQKLLRVDTINMIGESEAGKSSIAQSLVAGKPVTAAADDRTRVMQRLQVNLPSIFQESPINVNDFGGHHVYRCVIPLFLPFNGLSILAYNLMATDWEDQEKKVKKWLLTAVSKSTKIRLVIAGTRSDLRQSHEDFTSLKERMQRFSKGVIDELKSDVTKHIHELEDYLKKSNDDSQKSALKKRRNELTVLKTKLDEAELHCATVSCSKDYNDFQQFHTLVCDRVKEPELIPANWWEVMQDILKVNDFAFPRITMNHVKEMYKRHIFDDAQCNNLPVILRYLAYSSQIIWIENDVRLGCSIFQSPQKIVDICTKVLDHRADENQHKNHDHAVPQGSELKQVHSTGNVLDLPVEWKGASQGAIKMYKRGILQEKLLKKLLSQYTNHEIEEIVAFMESFNLISEIKLAEITETEDLPRDPESTEGRTFVITGNLPEEEPGDLETLIKTYCECKSSVFVNLSFVGCIVPLSFFATSLSSILAVARKQFTGHVSLPWRHGLCIRFDTLLLQVKCNDNEITFMARSISSERNPWYILYPVLQCLQEIISASWPGVAPEWQIMCPGCAYLKERDCHTVEIPQKPTFFKDFTPDLQIQPKDKVVLQVFDGCSHLVPRSLCHSISQDSFTDKEQEEIGKFYAGLENRTDDHEMNSEYNMRSSPHGCCIIINNVDFSPPSNPHTKFPRLQIRHGSDADAERLEKTFTYLGYSVRPERNLKSRQMVELLTKCSEIDHAACDSFVCCILSHGEDGSVYGCDSLPVRITDLTKLFEGDCCTSLASKPKMFFIQACQGEQVDFGVSLTLLTADSSVCSKCNDGPEQSSRSSIPVTAHFLIGFSTVPGYVSYRHTMMGSKYIQELCNLLMEYSGRYHLVELLTKVNERMAKEDNCDEQERIRKQMPQHRTTLVHKIFIRPPGGRQKKLHALEKITLSCLE